MPAGGDGSGGGRVELHAAAESATPGLAYLFDHMVGGRALFPGAGFLEAACAAADMSAKHADASGDALWRPLALARLTIRAPRVLQLVGGSADRSEVSGVSGRRDQSRLCCEIEHGVVRLVSSDARTGSGRQAHVDGTVTMAWPARRGVDVVVCAEKVLGMRESLSARI
eukprot:1192635-Pyramimonas_sp.AAC.1